MPTDTDPQQTEAPVSRAEGRAERIAAVGYDYDARAKQRVDDCNLCGSRGHAEVSRRERYGFEMPVRVCLRCGLAFASPRLTADEFADLYRGTYRELVSAFHGRPVDATSVQVEQRGYAAELRGFLERALPAGDPPASILDVGGSTGVVAAVIAEGTDAAVTVIDPAPDELAEAQRSGMEVIEGNAEDFDAGGRTWDLVLLCQTIEHLLDARATLTAIQGMLGPGGHAYVDIAELRFLMRRYGALEGALKLDHPYYLTSDAARAIFAVTGLEIVAEHVWDSDGHGFLLCAGDPEEPDWGALAASARDFVEEVRAQRAGRR